MRSAAREKCLGISDAVELGAVGFVSKTAGSEEIVKAISNVLKGEIYLPRELLVQKQSASKLAPAEPQGVNLPSPEAVRDLTKRQREVLRLLGEGKSNSEIAEALGRSEHTIRIHVSAILKTLDVPNRTMAALIARDCSAEFFV